VAKLLKMRWNTLSRQQDLHDLLPIGTVYDPFICRGLDALIYALYNGARFVVAGTPAGVTLAPEGAYGNVKGQSVFTHGAIIGLSQASSRDLTRESDRLVSGILDGNAYLAVNGRYQRLRIAGRDALRIRLVGNSPVTNRREIVDVYTVLARQDELFSIIQVVPANDQASYRAAFDEMVRSVRFS
jgi:hypothetical protein